MRGAFEKASLLHRDLSVDNIILVKEPDSAIRRGYLIDPELDAPTSVRDLLIQAFPTVALASS